MPRIVFARLKVKEQRQIVAGTTTDEPTKDSSGKLLPDNIDTEAISKYKGTSILQKCGKGGSIHIVCSLF